MDMKKEITLSGLVPKKLSLPGRSPRAPKPARASKAGVTAPASIVGLEVGATSLKAAQVVNNGGKKLVRIASSPLANGIVDGGEVRDPSALADALRAFFAEHDLPQRGVRLGLANSRIGVRTIEISGIDDELQLENAIGFRAHEMLAVPLDEAVIDYQVLGEEVDEDGAVTRKILLIVAYRDSIDRYLAATDAAGIQLTGIDLEAFALLRAVAEPSVDAESEVAVVAVSIGHERTTLAISDGRVCQFCRVLEWGGAEISSAVARALKITPDEAEGLKRGLSFAGEAQALGDLPVARVAEALEAARYELQTFVRELLSSLRFYQAQPGSLAIGEIVLAGGTAEMAGLTEELERELGIRVSTADPLRRVEAGDDVNRLACSGALTVAVGLGIED
ncbi:MAG: type IV pilus assembly protein PilM [Gaiellaceae bacterium]